MWLFVNKKFKNMTFAFSKGSILLFVVFVSVIVLTVTLTMGQVIITELRIGSDNVNSQFASYASENAIEEGYLKLKNGEAIDNNMIYTDPTNSNIKYNFQKDASNNITSNGLAYGILRIWKTIVTLNSLGSSQPKILNISAGYYHSLAVRSDGKVLSWGTSNTGALGDGTPSGTSVSRQTPGLVKANASTDLTDVTAVASNTGPCSAFSVALKNDGTVWAWGNYSFNYTQTYPTQVKGVGGVGNLTGIVAISAGCQHALALGSDGKVYSWGYNGQGQLGDNSQSNRTDPVIAVDVVLAQITQNKAISAGDTHSLAVSSDGKVWAWGNNAAGQLGIGSNSGQNARKQTAVRMRNTGNTADLTSVKSVKAGGNFSLALSADGKIWATGNNGMGQMGDNTTTTRLAPVRVLQSVGVDLAGITSIMAGYYHSFAISTDGKIWAWGYNGGISSDGRLGDNTTADKVLPVRVLTNTSGFPQFINAKLLTASRHSMSVKSDGSLYCWGYNSNYQLGDNTTVHKLTATLVNY